MSVLKILNELAATSGKKDKRAILLKHEANPELKAFFVAALNPKFNYYMKLPPADAKAGGKMQFKSLLEVFALLEEVLHGRKVTGHAARDWVIELYKKLDADNAEVVSRAIEHDPKCGVDTAVNDTWKDLIPEYPCMLATPMKAEKKQKIIAGLKFPLYAQEKMDGMRVNAQVNLVERTVTYISRQGKLLILIEADRLKNEMLDLASALAKLGNITDDVIVIDGEWIIHYEDGSLMKRKKSNGICNKASEMKQTINKAESNSIHFHVWDYIPLSAFNADIYNVTNSVRIENLAKTFLAGVYKMSHMVETRLCKIWAEVQEFYYEVLRNGGEGLIVKDGKGPWENKRSKYLYKMKEQIDCDLLCIGVYHGLKESTKHILGGLICVDASGKIQVDVGSGYDKAERKLYWENPELVIGKIIACTYNEVIANEKDPTKWSLFIPKFVEVRDPADKSKADDLSTEIK